MSRRLGGREGDVVVGCTYGGMEAASSGHSEVSQSQGPVSWGQEVGFRTGVCIHCCSKYASEWLMKGQTRLTA